MACRCIAPNAYLVRIARKWWMRLIPCSGHYVCTHCEQHVFLASRLPHERTCQPD